MRAAIYTRVSLDKRKTSRSVAQQEQEATTTCSEQGWQLSTVFSDNNRSASRFARKNRPGYEELLQFLREGNADVLVLWESSRGDRDLERWAGLLNRCRADNVLIHIVSHQRTYNLSIPNDWKTLATEGVDSEYESVKTRERVLRDMRASAAAGRPHGKTLYGYRRLYDPGTGTLLGQDIDEAKAVVIREAADRVSKGESCRHVATDFNNRGITAPRGGSWDLTQIKRLVTNPAYISQRVYQGQVVGGADWPAILEDTIFGICVSRLSDPRRRTQRDTAVKHLLSGAACCGVCGSRMRVQKNRSHRAYICVAGFHASVKVENLDQFIVNVILARMARPDAAVLLQRHSDNPDAAAAAVELAQVRARLDTFYDEAAEGKVSAAALARIEGKLLPRVAELEAASRVVPLPRSVTALAGPDPGRVWEQLTIGGQREVVQLLLEVKVHPTRRGARTFDPQRCEITWRS